MQSPSSVDHFLTMIIFNVTVYILSWVSFRFLVLLVLEKKTTRNAVFLENVERILWLSIIHTHYARSIAWKFVHSFKFSNIIISSGFYIIFRYIAPNTQTVRQDTHNYHSASKIRHHTRPAGICHKFSTDSFS